MRNEYFTKMHLGMTMKHRISGLGGTKDRLVNGKCEYSTTGLKVRKYIFWKERMRKV